jgi:hypothetical protein
MVRGGWSPRQSSGYSRTSRFHRCSSMGSIPTGQKIHSFMAVQNPLSDGLASKLTARVVYWTNIPAPYMVDRFNALARRENLQFEAWFSARTKKGRSWRVDEGGWDFPHRYLPSINRGAYPLAVPTPLLLGEVPDLLVTLTPLLLSSSAAC